MSNYFNTLQREAFRAGIPPRTKESREWFRKRLALMQSTTTKINRRDLMREEPLEFRPPTDGKKFVGNMFMFFYDAKNRETLPYWDAFPLVITAGIAKGGFYGLNLHYLPLQLRAKLLDGLAEITTNKRYDETTRFRTTYNMLQNTRNLRYFEPCFKHYLTSQVEGRISYVPPPEWEIAVFLPTAQWQKEKVNKVYSDSRRMLRNAS